jgi:hypothetical protein
MQIAIIALLVIGAIVCVFIASQIKMAPRVRDGVKDEKESSDA